MNLKSIIETILFVRAESMDIKTIMKITAGSEDLVHAALAELVKEYSERGIVLLEKDDSWQFASNQINGNYVEELTKSEFTQELSRSGLETLAIIAYKGPISRIEIEYLRGVNSSFTVRNLLMRGLIERVENPKDARSYLYRITFDFLKHFGLTSMEQLPRFEEFSKHNIEILEEKLDLSEDDKTQYPPEQNANMIE